jgi:hypothetical protein
MGVSSVEAGDAYALALAARAQGDTASEVECLSGLARVALRESRWDEVRRHARAALQRARSPETDHSSGSRSTCSPRRHG